MDEIRPNEIDMKVEIVARIAPESADDPRAPVIDGGSMPSQADSGKDNAGPAAGTGTGSEGGSAPVSERLDRLLTGEEFENADISEEPFGAPVEFDVEGIVECESARTTFLDNPEVQQRRRRRKERIASQWCNNLPYSKLQDTRSRSDACSSQTKAKAARRTHDSKHRQDQFYRSVNIVLTADEQTHDFFIELGSTASQFGDPLRLSGAASEVDSNSSSQEEHEKFGSMLDELCSAEVERWLAGFDGLVESGSSRLGKFGIVTQQRAANDEHGNLKRHSVRCERALPSGQWIPSGKSIEVMVDQPFGSTDKPRHSLSVTYSRSSKLGRNVARLPEGTQALIRLFPQPLRKYVRIIRGGNCEIEQYTMWDEATGSPRCYQQFPFKRVSVLLFANHFMLDFWDSEEERSTHRSGSNWE